MRRDALTTATMRICVFLQAMLMLPLSAEGQTIWVGAGVVRDVQRFSEDEVPNRLDGAAIGWTVLGGVRLLRHVVLTAEWSDAGVIEDARTTTVRIGARDVPITSTFRHGTRTVSALGGFGHRLGRANLAYLAGVASTTVRREFSTNAAALVLVSPSVSVSAALPLIDRVTAGVVGVDALIGLTPAFSIVAGARFQRLDLNADVSGWSARTLVGAGWVF